ncbi:TetR/AcrR family transcriptional regulator [Streptosporangiaceae bacterium NEAU-GS5]|nr:TetR/AcrR family transcriptional regulator [Streptosporangiaceae bacterium NEAU-GS5]
MPVAASTSAWRLVGAHGTSAVSVKEVAAAAQVSRRLVYFHCRNRAGLLLAMARHQDHLSGFRSRVAATRELPSVDGFVALIREWCGYLPELLPVARALEASLITGDEGGGAALQDRMDDLREAFRIALERVDEDARLAPGWSVGTAADWATARVQPGAWAHLVGMRGWSPADFTERTVRSLLAELVID